MTSIAGRFSYQPGIALHEQTNGWMSIRQGSSPGSKILLAQALTSDCGRFAITFNGRIDNRRQFASGLSKSLPPGSSDSELVLRAYCERGERCLDSLLGDFAFVVWDSGRERLLCARDPLGVRPFHYLYDGSTFVFASEIRQLVKHPNFSYQISERMIGCYLLYCFEDMEETLYKGLFRLPPGHYLLVDRNGLKKTRYWDLSPGTDIRYSSDAQYGEHFQEILVQAVRCRMDPQRSTGILLSGGLDSTSVGSTAQEISRERQSPLQTVESFSLLFDDHTCDERDYIDSFIAGTGISGHFLFPERERQALRMEATHPHPLGPLYSPNLFMMKPILSCARQRGIRLLLTGFGGDDVLVSLAYLSDLLRQGRWLTLRREIWELAKSFELSRRGVFWQFALRPALPPYVRRPLRSLAGWRLPRWIDTEFAKRTQLQDLLRSRDYQQKFPDPGRDSIYRRLFVSGAYPFFFEEQDRFAAPAGLEFRHPLYDLRLIEFLFRLPQTQKTWGGESKIVLRNAVRGLLPEPLRRRRDKADFSLFMDRELCQNQRAYAEELISGSRLCSAGILDTKEIASLWTSYCSAGGGAGRWPILMILNLERWFRQL